MRKLIFLILLSFVFASCHTLSDLRIEKRRYRKGYYVHLRPHRYTEPVTNPKPEAAVVQQTAKNQPVSAKQEMEVSQQAFSQYAAPPVSAAPASEHEPQRSVEHNAPSRINRQ